MATLGSAPSFNWVRWADVGTSCATAPNQVDVGNYTMPSAGWVTGIVIYVAGDGSSQTHIGCVWDASSNLLGSGSGVASSGTRTTGGQGWKTSPCGFLLSSGQQIRIGWTKASGATMVWSANNGGSGRWGYGGNPGNFSSCGSIEQPGAYISYNPISNPSSTTNAASSVGSTTATLNGTVSDGGQNGSGDPNHSKYYFQYSTDPGLAGATNTAQVNFDGLSQAASQGISGLAVNTTYYFRVVSVNDAGTTNGSILSFSTLGLPNAPTLTSPASGSAVNAQTSGVTFAWTYNTGGAGGGETNYALKLTTGGVDHWWNGTSLVTTETYVAEATTKTIGAGILSPSVSYLWTVSSQDANGKGPYASPFTLISEGPPNAPTLTSPPSGTYLDVVTPPTLQWTYNPGNAVGGQTKFHIRRKISGSGSYSYFNVGTNSWQSTDVANTGSTGSYTFGAGLWSDGNTYNWSIATEDAGGIGPYAADATLTAQAIPVVTVTAPSGPTAQSKPAVVWSTSFPSGASGTAYQVRTFSAAQYGAVGFNPATSAATDDSGVVSSAGTSYQIATSLPAGSSYRSYVQVTETGAEVSGFLSFGAYTVTLDLPSTPTLSAVASTDPATGAPLIQLTAQANINILSSNDASFEGGLGTWVPVPSTGNCSITQSSTQALDGSFSMRESSTAAGTMSANSGQYVVLPSTAYTAMAYFRAGATGRTVTVGISWYDSTHTLISTSTGTGVADVTTGWTQAVVNATSPANAAYALIIATVQATAGAAELHYIDEVGLFPGTISTWSAGGLLSTAGIVILRSDGVYVRNASPVNAAPVLSTQAPVVINDYEVTPLQPYTYQALVQATGAQGQVQSAYSTQTGASLSTTRWWQLDPTNPSSAVAAQLIQFNPSATEQSTAHQVLGQTTMNVVASAMMSTDMTATVELFDAATYAAFYALLTSQKTVFFSDPFGNSYYFRIAPGPGGMSSGMGNKAHDTQLLPSTAGGPHRTISITGISQPRPAV